jgi:hypothetical protein
MDKVSFKVKRIEQNFLHSMIAPYCHGLAKFNHLVQGNRMEDEIVDLSEEEKEEPWCSYVQVLPIIGGNGQLYLVLI